MELLSDIELFYSQEIFSKEILLTEDEFAHCVKVFRKQIHDEIYVTDGQGKIYKTKITTIGKRKLKAEILSTVVQPVRFPDYHFCVPLLRNKDRLRFTIEKLTELGITKIIIYQAQRSVSDKVNIQKLRKIAIETIKQSLLANLPEIKFINSLSQLNDPSSIKMFFDQKSEIKFSPSRIKDFKKVYFIFGPEGGLTENELNYFENSFKFSLAENRLRTETAILKVASAITL